MPTDSLIQTEVSVANELYQPDEVERITQPDYIHTAQEIAADVLGHGDMVDNLRYLSPVKTGLVGAAALVGTVRVLDVLGGTYYVLPTLAGAATARGVMTLGKKWSSRRKERIASQFERQEELAKECGEKIEFFQVKKGNLAVRWCGAENDDIHLEPIEERAARVAAVAEHTNAHEVILTEELATLIGLNREATNEKNWIETSKRVKDEGRASRYSIVSMPADEFISFVDNLVLERPLTRDTELLAKSLDFIKTHKPRSALSLLYSNDLNFENPTHVNKLVNSISREVQKHLDDYDIVQDDDGRHKIYKIGLLGNNTARSAANPTIHWFGDGLFKGTEPLLSFIGKTPEQLLAILDDHALPNKKYRAALTLAYIEATKLSKGINLVSTTITPHEESTQIPYQTRMYRPGMPSPPDASEMSRAYPMPRRGKRYGRLALAGLTMLGVYGLAMDNAQDHRGAIANKPILTPIDNAVSAPFRFANDHIPDLPDWMTVREIKLQDVNTESNKLTYGNVVHAANTPQWLIQSQSGADSSGYWLRNMDYDLDMDQQWQAWLHSRPDDKLPGISTASINQNVHGQDDPLQGNPGFMVRRTITPGQLDQGRLYLPIKSNTSFKGLHILDIESNGLHSPPVLEQSNGPIYVDLQYLNNSQVPTDRKFTLTYWLQTGGKQGVGETAAEVDKTTRARGQGGEWHAVDDNKLRTQWANLLGKSDYSVHDVEKYLESKKYSLTAVPQTEFTDEAALLKALTDSQTANCNSANTALVLSDPIGLSMADGYLNNNSDGSVEVLSSREKHGYVFDTRGEIHDATPNASEDAEFNDEYFRENFSLGDTDPNRETSAIEKGFLGLLVGSMALSTSFMFYSEARYEYRRKQYEKISDTDARAAWDVVNHMFYAPAGTPMSSLSKAGTSASIRKDFSNLGHDQTTKEKLKQLRRYIKSHPEVSKSALKTAKILLQH